MAADPSKRGENYSKTHHFSSSQGPLLTTRRGERRSLNELARPKSAKSRMLKEKGPPK